MLHLNLVLVVSELLSNSDFTLLAFFLFFPIFLEDHWGVTDDFTITSFHLVLFSAALLELAKSIPVHSLILTSHLFLLATSSCFSIYCAL